MLFNAGSLLHVLESSDQWNCMFSLCYTLREAIGKWWELYINFWKNNQITFVYVNVYSDYEF